MDLYHLWVYINVLNAKWFIWSMVIVVMAFNILAPIIIWAVINGRELSFVKNKEEKNKIRGES